MVFKSSPIYEKTFFIAHSSAIPDLFQTWKRESWSISLFSSKASWTKLAIASACFDVTCGCISRYLFGDRFSKKSNSIRFCYSDMLLLFLVQLHVLVEFSLLAPCAVRGGTVTLLSLLLLMFFVHHAIIILSLVSTKYYFTFSSRRRRLLSLKLFESVLCLCIINTIKKE